MKQYWPIILTNIVLIPCLTYTLTHLVEEEKIYEEPASVTTEIIQDLSLTTIKEGKIEPCEATRDSKTHRHPDNGGVYALDIHCEPEKQYMGLYNLSRYYTVIPGQKKYYLNRTYEEDFEINCQGDCFKTANGHLLSDEQWGKVVACPPNIKIGSRLLVEGIGEVTCQDRGGAIKGRRLDVWMGVGDAGVDRLYGKVTTYGGERQVYLLK